MTLSDLLARLGRFLPVVSFFGGFVWDALTLGKRVGPVEFWTLGGYLLGAAILAWWLAWRDWAGRVEPWPDGTLRGRLLQLAWQAPYLLLQFLFGGIFSALFIFYSKSAGNPSAWFVAALLGGLLVANEFMKARHRRRFTLTWALFALCAALLLNFVIPHLVGSLNPLWFHASTLLAVLLTLFVRFCAPGRPGRTGPAWSVGVLLLAGWHLGMIAPVPLVKRDLAVGHEFRMAGGAFQLAVEAPPWWMFWRDSAARVHLESGQKLYGVSAVFAPRGVVVPLEHRWEIQEADGWRVAARTRFLSQGGREGGFRGYSWVLDPPPGQWRLVVGTQDGRTIAELPVRIERGSVRQLSERRY